MKFLSWLYRFLNCYSLDQRPYVYLSIKQFFIPEAEVEQARKRLVKGGHVGSLATQQTLVEKMTDGGGGAHRPGCSIVSVPDAGANVTSETSGSPASHLPRRHLKRPLGKDCPAALSQSPDSWAQWTGAPFQTVALGWSVTM